MPYDLTDLSTELHLKIVDELRSDVAAEEIQDDREEDPYDYNAETFDEKQERKKNASKYNRVRDLLNWSCTSHFFRELLAPYVFETIRLRNTDSSGSSVTSLSQSKHNQYVKELIYIGSAPGDAHVEEEAYSDTEAILPENVSSILSGLNCFPSLETLSIEFPYHFADYDEWDEGLDLCAEEESDEDVKTAESEIAWRALMARTYTALIQNKGTNLKSLEIKKLGPMKVSTFNDPAFHQFLGQIERFTLSIYGEDNGAGWQINKVEHYIALMSKLDTYFFNHLTSCTYLTLEAPEEGPLGLEGMNHIPLALKKDQMPVLKTIYLKYVLVGQELIDFLAGHSKTLETLTLRQCSAEPEGLADNGITWKTFFDGLYEAEFEKLYQLSLLYNTIPLTSEECNGKAEDEEKVSAEVKKARQILKDDSNRRLFPYISIDDKYGMIFELEGENLASFRKGEDQAAYDRLMCSVRANGEKGDRR